MKVLLLVLTAISFLQVLEAQVQSPPDGLRGKGSLGFGSCERSFGFLEPLSFPIYLEIERAPKQHDGSEVASLSFPAYALVVEWRQVRNPGRGEKVSNWETIPFTHPYTPIICGPGPAPQGATSNLPGTPPGTPQLPSPPRPSRLGSELRFAGSWSHTGDDGKRRISTLMPDETYEIRLKLKAVGSWEETISKPQRFRIASCSAADRKVYEDVLSKLPAPSYFHLMRAERLTAPIARFEKGYDSLASACETIIRDHPEAAILQTTRFYLAQNLLRWKGDSHPDFARARRLLQDVRNDVRATAAEKASTSSWLEGIDQAEIRYQKMRGAR